MEFNKKSNQLRLWRYQGPFGPVQCREASLNQIVMVSMAALPAVFDRWQGIRRKSYNLYVLLANHEKIELCPYSPLKPYRKQALRQVKQFLAM